MTKSSEYENFDRTMRQLVRFPHSDVKARLDVENAEKAKKRKAKRTSASRATGVSRRDSAD
jgi:hypothetical protein